MRVASSEASRTQLHDLELAALAAAGGRQEYGVLVRRHSATVRALLRRMGADPATADDVAQDAFLQAYERIADFRGDGAFSAWIRRIAARLFLKRRRREAEQMLQAQAMPAEASDYSSDPSARMDLDEAMKALSPPERLCLSLCYGAGLSHAEVAEALNTPLGTVKSHVKRGLDALRDRMAAPDVRSTAHG